MQGLILNTLVWFTSTFPFQVRKQVEGSQGNCRPPETTQEMAQCHKYMRNNSIITLKTSLLIYWYT